LKYLTIRNIRVPLLALIAFLAVGIPAYNVAKHQKPPCCVVNMEQKMKNAHGGTIVAKSKHVTVSISNYAFSPQILTVRVGTKITWTNHDQTAHTATANKGAFDTGTINPGKSKTIIMSKIGTYPYHCIFHAFMTGTINVVKA
jgi:plastocyanin